MSNCPRTEHVIFSVIARRNSMPRGLYPAMHDWKSKSPLTSPDRRDLIIFDCDGVLVDSELLSCNALITCLRRHAIDVDLQTAIHTFLGRSTRAVEDYCALHGHILPDDFFGELGIAVRAAFASTLQPIPGAAAVLRSLSVPFCVASSSDIERIEHSLRLTGLADMVGGRVFSAAMVRNGKPAPDLFVHAAAAMGAALEKTLVIEDSVSGVQAAKAAGMSVWGFVGGSHYASRDGRALLKAAGADRVFDRMADFDYHAAGFIDGARR
jgi:HAD superfamily hydrolase (TIGR01509 family)